MDHTSSINGLTLEPYQVVMRPLVTEKGTDLSEQDNVFAFEVHPQATKHDIKRAVEALWSVRVIKVRTQNRIGKPRRTRLKVGVTKTWKKALVKLHEEDRIAFF